MNPKAVLHEIDHRTTKAQVSGPAAALLAGPGHPDPEAAVRLLVQLAADYLEQIARVIRRLPGSTLRR